MGVWGTIVALVALRRVEGTPVTCWGLNTSGEAANVEFLTALGDVVTVDMGYQHACALRTEGDVACWGSNSNGQATPPGGLTNVQGVVCGAYHSCAWDELGGVTCWGLNDKGQTTVPGGLGNVVGLTCGWKSTCSWNLAGDVSCWGEDREGELTVPASVQAMTVKGVSLGIGPHACAWDNVGTQPLCWGSDAHGQSAPVTLADNGFVDIAVGAHHSCGLRSSGEVACWGDYLQQQTAVPGVFSDGVNIAAGLTYSCVGKEGVVCWGDEQYGESTVPAGLGSDLMRVTAFHRTTCAWEKKLSTTTSTSTASTVTTIILPPTTTTTHTITTTTHTTTHTTTVTTSPGPTTTLTSSTRSTSTRSTSTRSTSTNTMTTRTITTRSVITVSIRTATLTTSTMTTSTKTSTITTLGLATFFGTVQEDVEDATQPLVDQSRTDPGPGRWVQQTPVGWSEAVSIQSEDLTKDGSLVNIGNAALAPAELLRPYVQDGDDIVVVVTRVNNSDYLLPKVTEHGEDVGEIHGMVEVTLYNRQTGEVVSRDGDTLDHNILVKVSDDRQPAGREDGACVHVRQNAWSTEGVQAADDAELNNATGRALSRRQYMDVDQQRLVTVQEELTMDGVWCSTRKFGLNAFLLGPPLTCARASISAADGDDGDGYDNDSHHWMTSRPAWLYFAHLLKLAWFHVYALQADKKYRKAGWTDRRLETVVQAVTSQARNGKIGRDYPHVTMALLLHCYAATERRGTPIQSFTREALLHSFNGWGYGRRTWIFFRAFHPWLSLADPPFMLSCVKNAKLMTDSVLFPLFVLCLIFSATGEMLAAGSDPSCAPGGYTGGRAFLIAGLCCIFLCGLPSRFQAFFYARHNPEQPVPRVDTCFWVLETIWTIIHLVITFLFLAHIAPVDRWKWEVLLVLVLLCVYLVKPLLIALVLALWTLIVVWLWPKLLQDPTVVRQNTSICSGDDRLTVLDEASRETVKDLSHRGITITHLLDFYQRLGTVVMPQFKPQQATTEDVVRSAVIPLSRGDAIELYGQPMKVRLGVLHLEEPPERVCDVFVRCEVSGRPHAALDTWAIDSAGLCEVDWNMEAELLGYQPGDCLELALIEADTGRKLCAGRLRSRVLAGQREVPLITNSDARMGTILLQITAAVNAGATTVPRTSLKNAPAAPVPQSQGYLEWCGSSDALEHPAVTDLGRIMPNCGMPHDKAGSSDVEMAEHSGDEGESAPPRRSQVVQGFAYASVVNAPLLPGKMVTHNWGNCFTHVMATVLADALGQETYDQFLPLLAARDIARLRSMLGAAGKLEESYWIDAFSVNQHSSICASPRQLVDSTGARISACTCATPKMFSGPECENDKMPLMMSYLNALWAERSGECKHVVAVDPARAVFGRTWCLAEMHEADQANMPQTFVMQSFDDIQAQANHALVVEGIDIRISKVTYVEDKKHLLDSIDDVDEYNERLRSLVSHHLKTTDPVPAEQISTKTCFLDTLLI